MAINLWKLGGKPTSYNPLPIDYTINQVTLPIGDFVVSFRAKSATNSFLKVWCNNPTVVLSNFVLTNDFKTYSFSIPALSSRRIYIQDTDNKGDIIIEDIQLVQKPLPKFTINGIDGFVSGKWSLHANARVLDDETLELGASAVAQFSSYDFSASPKENYYFSISASNGARVTLYSFDGSTYTPLYDNRNTSGLITQVITTPSSCKGLRLNLNNDSVGTFTFKKPMLNLGTTPAPYSKKTGERMVLPTVKGNLIPTDVSQWVKGSVQVNGTDTVSDSVLRSVYVPVKPNTTYFIRSKTGYQSYVMQYDIAKVGTTAGIAWGTGDRTFTTSSNTYFVRVLYGLVGLPAITVDEIVKIEPQLNEGTTAQPYSPYAVQVNKKPKKYVPKKNLFDGALEDGQLGGANGLPIVDTAISRPVNFIPVKPSTRYSANVFNGVTSFRYHFYDGGKNFISSIAGTGGVIDTPVNCYFMKFHISKTNLTVSSLFQIEEGTTATSYEPYQLILPRAKRKLARKRRLEARR